MKKYLKNIFQNRHLVNTLRLSPLNILINFLAEFTAKNKGEKFKETVKKLEETAGGFGDDLETSLKLCLEYLHNMLVIF